MWLLISSSISLPLSDCFVECVKYTIHDQNPFQITTQHWYLGNNIYHHESVSKVWIASFKQNHEFSHQHSLSFYYMEHWWNHPTNQLLFSNFEVGTLFHFHSVFSSLTHSPPPSPSFYSVVMLNILLWSLVLFIIYQSLHCSSFESIHCSIVKFENNECWSLTFGSFPN